MKLSEGLVFLGVAGAVYYFFVHKSRDKETAPSYLDAPADNSANAPQIVYSADSKGQVITKVIKSPSEGVEFINDTISSGGTLARTSQTLMRNVNATLNGTEYTGNVALLGGKPLFVGIKSNATSKSAAAPNAYIPKGVTVKSVSKKDSIAYKKGYFN